MPAIEENGLTISYGKAGAGPDLVLLHAAGSTGAQWRGVLGELGDRFRTLTPDLWGHGRTSFWPNPETLLHDRQAELVKRIVDEESIGAFDLVGHSYGGGTAIRFVMEHPEMVRSLVLIEPMMACFLRELGETDALDELEGIQYDFKERLDADGPEARELDGHAVRLQVVQQPPRDAPVAPPSRRGGSRWWVPRCAGWARTASVSQRESYYFIDDGGPFPSFSSFLPVRHDCADCASAASIPSSAESAYGRDPRI